MGLISRINSKRRVQYLPHTMQRIMIILLATLTCASSWATAKKLVNHQSKKKRNRLQSNPSIEQNNEKCAYSFSFKTGNHWNEVASQPIQPFVYYVTASIRQHSLFDAPTTYYHRHHQIMRVLQVLAWNREHFNGAKKVKCRRVYFLQAREIVDLYRIRRLSEESDFYFSSSAYVNLYILKHGVCLQSQTFWFLRYYYYYVS